LDIITICGVICGAEGWVEIEEFGKTKGTWLKELLELPNRIPSHDTFGRVFARLDPKQFEASFFAWVQSLNEGITGVIAIDGKTLRRSHDQTMVKKALHMVSAWAAEHRLVLAQTARRARNPTRSPRSRSFCGNWPWLDALSPLMRWGRRPKLWHKSLTKKVTMRWRSKRIKAPYITRSKRPLSWPRQSSLLTCSISFTRQ
jgi:hypothetical protein